MAAPRPPKWDWTSHLPKMIEYYNTQMSIPDIYKAIQCEGFEPCQRSVYAKFKAMGYPTDPVGRSRLLEARSPSNTTAASEGIFTPPTQVQSPNVYTNGFIHQTALCPLPEDQMLVDPTELWDHGMKLNHPVDRTFNHSELDAYMDFRENTAAANDPNAKYSDPNHNGESSTSEIAPWASPDNEFGISTTSFDDTFDFDSAAMELHGADYFGIDTGSNVSLSGNHDNTVLHPKPAEIDWNSNSPFGPGSCDDFNASSMELDQVVPPSRDELAQQQAQPQTRRSGSFRSGSIDIKMPFSHFMANSNASGTRNKIRSLFRTKSGSSIRSSSSGKKYAVSQYTSNTQDSGYGSGFGSSLTIDEVRRINSQSLREFNGLFRVACHNLHEPRGKAQCKDIAPCSYCRYSSIHNLGWSARYLKLEVFMSELRLEGVYNFAAIDAAGNTALHYAAAGGASFQHLKALIDAGVDPYAANTSGQLFIYCLRPLRPFTLEPNSDCLKSDDLVNLLNLLGPRTLQNWRDNDGQSILHALFSIISEPDLRAKAFEIFLNAGYLPTVRDRFGRTAKNVEPLTYDCHGQVITTDRGRSSRSLHDDTLVEPSDEMTCEDLITADWRARQVKQIKSQNILVEARRDPTYTEPSSNDNILHALSRLRSSNDTLLNLEQFNSKDPNFKLHNRQGNQILLNLEYFIPRGVDLNLHNRDGCFPLQTFICDRPWEDAETGATLSKYLDTILWKDAKARIPNNINVNMKDREGATALHCASIRGRPDSVRSLIEAGGNVNARSDDGTSVLQSAFNALNDAIKHGDAILVHLVREVISHLEHAGAVLEPKSLQERGLPAR